MYLFNNPQVEQIITLALNEDIGTGDITTLSTIPEDKTATGRFVAKEDMIICGIDLAKHIFGRVDPSIEMKANFKDGDAVKKGDVIAVVSGNAQNVLTGERTALNFMQRLTGICHAPPTASGCRGCRERTPRSPIRARPPPAFAYSKKYSRARRRRYQSPL